MTTIGAKLKASHGIGYGFDFLRVFLAISVVAAHSFAVVGVNSNAVPIVWYANYWVLAIFFGLSGFLITGSAMRLDLGNFLINRGIRIFPALAVEIVLAVVLLGPIFTSLTLSGYFSHPWTAKYLTNILGLVNYDLPGVFRDNPSVKVNASLWTVPFELGCYAVISFGIVFGLLRRPKLIVLSTVAFAFFGLLAFFVAPENSTGIEHIIWKVVDRLAVDRGSRLYVCFLLGILAYLYKDKIPYDPKILFGCLVLNFAISLFPGPGTAKYPFVVFNVLTSASLIYIMAYVGVTPIPKLPFFKGGDYSYGIYLYGFPFQQAAYHLVPSDSAFVNFVLSMPPILLFAYASWHLIEKPMVAIRKKFSFIGGDRLASPAGDSSAETTTKEPVH